MNDLIISNTFFKREKRRSFVVGESMKRSWASDLMILEDLKEVCQKHSLKIFACYGTLLGAVRDRGFIAWDDDIDLGLVGEDYVSFLDIISKEYGYKYNILNSYTRPWYHMNFTHITNGKEVNFSRDHLKKWNGCPFMAGPDIYPYYYIPRNLEEEKYILHMLEKIDYTIALSRQSSEMAQEKGNLKSNDEIIKALTLNLYELQKETGYEFNNDTPLDNQLEILYDQVCRITEESEADYVTRYDEYSVDKNKKYPKEYFQTTINIPFEMTTMPVPIGYDSVLKARFGENYIIPRREAAAHDYPFYRKQLTEEIDYGNEGIELSTIGIDLSKDDLINTIQYKGSKKVILYHTNIRYMLINSQNVISKIEDVLNLTKSNSGDIELIWLPDMFSKSEDYAMDLFVPELIEQYENLIQEYSRDKGFVIDRNCLSNELIEGIDYFYGDEDDIAKEFEKVNKKITIQEYSNTELEIKVSLGINELEAEKANCCDSMETKSNKEIYAIPNEWKKMFFDSAGIRKKAVMYFLSVSKIYQNKEKALDKIEKSLEKFKENKDDITLLWYVMPITLDLHGVFDSEFLNDLDHIVDRFKDEGWGIYVEDEHLNDAIEISDAFYGDPDAVTLRMKDMQKPVMLQNYDIL